MQTPNKQIMSAAGIVAGIVTGVIDNIMVQNSAVITGSSRAGCWTVFSSKKQCFPSAAVTKQSLCLCLCLCPGLDLRPALGSLITAFSSLYAPGSLIAPGSTSAPAPGSTSAPAPGSTSAPAPGSTSAFSFISALTPTPAPASAPVSAPISAPVSAPVSALGPGLGSGPAYSDWSAGLEGTVVESCVQSDGGEIVMHKGPNLDSVLFQTFQQGSIHGVLEYRKFDSSTLHPAV